MRRSSLIMLFFVFSVSMYPQDLRFSIGEWFPYTSSSGGVATEIITEVCKRAGMRPIIEYVPWSRAEKDVAEGRSFASFPYSITEARKKTYLFSDSFVSADTAIIRNTAKAPFRADLRGCRVGLTAGSEALTEALKKHGAIFEETQNIEMSLRKLENGRIDCIVEDYYVIRKLLRTTTSENIALYDVITPFPLPRRDYRLLVSRTYPNAQLLLERFNRVLSEYIQSEAYAHILAKYDMSEVGR